MGKWAVNVLFLAVVVFTQAAAAQELIECPASQLDPALVNFNGDQCRRVRLQDYAMSRKSVWLLFTSPNQLQREPLSSPLGLFMSGHMSASVFVDRDLIGRKGRSATNKDAEMEGPFDWVIHLPDGIDLDRRGLRLLVHMSSFHTNRSAVPINRLYVSSHKDATAAHFANYWPSLLPIGALLIGLVYLLRRLLMDKTNRHLLCLLALVAIALMQATVEVFRGFYPYPYSWHDIRLGAIWSLSFMFGQVLFITVVQRFANYRILPSWIACVAIVAIAQLLVSDIDKQATLTILVPALLSVGVLLSAAYQRSSIHWYPAAVLTGFSGLVLYSPFWFLDVYFYYCVAGLVMYLLLLDAHTLRQQTSDLLSERARTRDLEIQLQQDKVASRQTTLQLKDGSSLVQVNIDDIFYLQGAGDYVEVHMAERIILHSGSLANLIQTLPGHFLKVHRSYVVNGTKIHALKRLRGGTAEVTLVNDERIPVSRRQLPTVIAAMTND